MPSVYDLDGLASDAVLMCAADKFIGKGGSSHVYRCCLSDGKELAVKILKPSEHILNEFVSEIEIITALNHKNIISLFGFCFENDNLVLVYDYLSRGSLEENLHGMLFIFMTRSCFTFLYLVPSLSESYIPFHIFMVR